MWKDLEEQAELLPELEAPLEYEVHRDGVTQSMLGNFNKCSRYLYLNLRKWEPIVKPTVFANGTITHDLLDKMYMFRKKYNKIPTKLHVSLWARNYPTENPEWLADQVELRPFYQCVAKVILQEYLSHYKQEFGEIEVVSTEEVFDIQWNGHRLRGKKDMVFLKKKKRYIGETKTMGRISVPDLTQHLVYNVQNLMYQMSEELQGHKVEGVVYNIVRNPGHKMYSGETLHSYEIRLRKAIKKDPAHFFIRIDLKYSEEQIEQFKKELFFKLCEIQCIQEGSTYPYKNENSCLKPFRCSFMDACASGSLKGFTRTKTLFSELQE